MKVRQTSVESSQNNQPYQCAIVAHEYCSSSSLHGFPWIAQTGWKSGARPFWVAVVTSAIALCIYMSLIVWIRFTENPTIFVVESIYNSALKAPFPSIEICNSHKFYKPNTRRISEMLQTRGYNESQTHRFFKDNLGLYNKGGILPEYLEMNQVLSDIGLTYKSIYNEIRQPCTVMFTRCAWRDIEVNCSKMFQSSLSSSGYCCKFTPAYFRNSTKDFGLNYIAGFDEKEALSLNLNISNQRDFDKNADLNKATIYLYNREKTLNFFTLYEGQRLDLSVEPSWNTATERVRMMSPGNRKCGFVRGPINPHDDVRVRYSYEGCVTHYYIRRLLNRCKCVHYYAAVEDPMAGWDKFPFCTIADYECVIRTSTIIDILAELADEGHCLSACDNVQYNTNVDYIDLSKHLNTSQSKLNVYFQRRLSSKYTRDEAMSPFQLFAAFGGVFGLCLGGTVVSIMELLWFIIKFLAVLIFRCKQTNNVQKNKSIKTDQSTEDEEFNNYENNMLYLNELLPYGYPHNKHFFDKGIK